MKTITSLGLGVLLLAGCVSVLPEQVVPDALYRLNSPVETSSLTPVSLPYSVTVFEPEGSSLLLGRSVVFEDDRGALSVISFAQWSDPASRQLQSLLIDRLSVRKAGDNGLIIGDKLGAFTETDLKWRVTDFVVRDKEAHVSMQVALLTARSRRVLAQFEVNEVVPFTGKDKDAGILALKQASIAAMNTIASSLPTEVDQSELKAVSRRR